jgi:hypothetical protein
MVGESGFSRPEGPNLREPLFGPVPMQRLEGLVLLVAAVIGFAEGDASWWWFVALILVPDVTAAGYLVSPSMGAMIYNLGHTLIVPGLLFGWYWLSGPDSVLALAWVWMAHIGIDRLFGYGLKYPDAFTHTHLGTIGRSGGVPA